MTIKETRKILELDYKYTDEEVQQIIDETMMLAKFFIDRYMKGELSADEFEKETENLLKNSSKLKLFTDLKKGKED